MAIELSAVCLHTSRAFRTPGLEKNFISNFVNRLNLISIEEGILYYVKDADAKLIVSHIRDMYRQKEKIIQGTPDFTAFENTVWELIRCYMDVPSIRISSLLKGLTEVFSGQFDNDSKLNLTTYFTDDEKQTLFQLKKQWKDGKFVDIFRYSLLDSAGAIQMLKKLYDGKPCTDTTEKFFKNSCTQKRDRWVYYYDKVLKPYDLSKTNKGQIPMMVLGNIIVSYFTERQRDKNLVAECVSEYILDDEVPDDLPTFPSDDVIYGFQDLHTGCTGEKGTHEYFATCGAKVNSCFTTIRFKTRMVRTSTSDEIQSFYLDFPYKLLERVYIYKNKCIDASKLDKKRKRHDVHQELSVKRVKYERKIKVSNEFSTHVDPCTYPQLLFAQKLTGKSKAPTVYIQRQDGLHYGDVAKVYPVDNLTPLTKEVTARRFLRLLGAPLLGNDPELVRKTWAKTGQEVVYSVFKRRNTFRISSIKDQFHSPPLETPGAYNSKRFGENLKVGIPPRSSVFVKKVSDGSRNGELHIQDMIRRKSLDLFKQCFVEAVLGLGDRHLANVLLLTGHDEMCLESVDFEELRSKQLLPESTSNKYDDLINFMFCKPPHKVFVELFKHYMIKHRQELIGFVLELRNNFTEELREEWAFHLESYTKTTSGLHLINSRIEFLSIALAGI